MGTNEMDISGLDEAEVIAALHNGTKALGMGMLHDICRDITADEVRTEVAAFHRDNETLYFDYYHGRPLKVRIGNGKLSGVNLYDRDAGEGACLRAVNSVRAKGAK